MVTLVNRSRPDKGEDRVDANRVLLDEFDALDPSLQEDAAEKLTVLWHCFVEVFRSPGQFQAKPRAIQDAYIAKYEGVATRSIHVRHSKNGHLHYSVALMLQFLRAARDDDGEQSALDLSHLVAGLINRVRNRQLEATWKSIDEALSKPLQSSAAILSTGMVADDSLEFPVSAGNADADYEVRRGGWTKRASDGQRARWRRSGPDQ